MRYGIDIVILDKKNQVKKMRKNLMPNKIFLWNPLYKSVLEMPVGFIEKYKISIGTHITVQM